MTRRADWPVALGVVSAAALGAAIFVEHVMQVAPCELCLVERWPWRVALAAALAALVLPRARSVLWVAAVLALVASVGLGVLHTGVEWHVWPSPFPLLPGAGGDRGFDRGAARRLAGARGKAM